MEKTRGSSDPYYDIFEDFELIVSSFLTQYGIRIMSDDFKSMKWDEFYALLSGLSPDTPLGRIVAIRSETDKDIINNFSKDQKRIWREWRTKAASNKSKEETEQFYADISSMFRAMVKEGEDV